ncbi:MAG TPA: ABC transporter ATP-binding protein [Polyangiaceae bacterium]|jgi:ATP-binding cassette subfamily B protein|nr:ABC transporter ATP-binding protein [Polyangiaceae bacterium]
MSHLKKLLRFAAPYSRRSLLALLLLTTLVVFDLSIPRLIQTLIDHGIAQHDRGVVLRTSALMLGISLLSVFIAIGNNNLSVFVGESVGRDLREAIFVKIQSFSYGNLDRQNTGQLLVRLSSDTSAIQRLLQMSLRIGTRAPLLMIGSLVLMITTSLELALTMIPLLLVTTFVIIFFLIKMEPMYRFVQQKLDRLNTVLQENVAGIRLVKAFVRQRHERARFELNNLAYTEESVKVMQFAAFMSPVLTLCVNGGIVIVIWAGGLQAAHGKLSSGQLVAFINYLLTTMTPLLMMTILSNVWASGIASAKRIDEVLNVVPEIQDAPDASALELSGAPRIEFEDVSFSYAASQAEPVLDGVSFVAEPGETVAILGATGAGKSTLVKLIPRFYDVTRGRVLLGGRDVRELSQDSLLSQIGVVPQESVLFSGTVRDNIRYGKPEASDGEVLRAARAAQADEFISKLDQGYDARVEQRGQNFSGGQRQRLAIARALLLEPKILILDDSTSAVDVETETKIQQALAAQHPEQTRIVVAQRISSVLGADKILVLDAGRIVARGRHAELMKSSRVYQEIYASQLGTGITPESVAESAAVNS